VLQALLKQFPAQINRENILKGIQNQERQALRKRPFLTRLFGPG
jgi:hypothetical protein